MAKAETKKPAKPIFEIPDDFDDEASFLADMRQKFHDDIQADKLNREAALEDMRFLVGDQWDDIVRQRREAARKPVLTVNRLPAFVGQVVGNRRLNETSIKIIPDHGGNENTARVREGLVRNIQKVSRAELAFDKALENQVACGIGNFQVCLDYEGDDVFEQEIKIEGLPDALSVVWDRESLEPTGIDAKHVFVIDSVSKKDFERQWPWAQPADMVMDVTLRGDLRMNGWIALDDYRVVSYWNMRTRKRVVALMNDGSTQDITDELEDEKTAAKVLQNVVQRKDGTPIMREVNRKYAQMYLCSGLDILEGPYELPIPRVPVFRVPGWEVHVGQWRHRWGLIRFLKDPQRLHNYWRSVIAEKLQQTPRASWIASDKAVEGRENQWRQAHLTDDPLLIWNSDSGTAPARVPPAQLEGALIEEAQTSAQDMKDVSNMHEANFGMPSNEVSGAAIVARQRVSDTGTIIYHDNLALAIEQAGIVMNELIPTVYDTPRIIKVLGADAKQDMVVINKEGDKNSVDLTIGKYQVSVTTGPSYTTKRIEAAANMMNLINAMPQVAAMAADLIVEAQDWPQAEEIARRLRLMLPPGVLSPDKMTPEQQQAHQAASQTQDQTAQIAQAKQVADIQKVQAQTAEAAARAKNFQAQADAIPQKLNTETANAASQAADRELRGHLETIKVGHGE